MCQISKTIDYLKSLGRNDKIEEFKIKCKEEHGLEYNDEKMKKIEQFMYWMREGGAKFRNIKMKYYGPDYRGIHTYEKIDAGDIFLNVPYEMIITPQLGESTEIGKKIINTSVKVYWDYLVFITVFLMTEMHNPNSKWKPYMDVYPRIGTIFPIFYNDHEKSLLKGTPMLDQIDSEYRILSEEYKRLVQAIPEFSEFTEEEYIRNKVIVVSRIFCVKMNGVRKRIMVPLAGIFC